MVNDDLVVDFGLMSTHLKKLYALADIFPVR